MFAAITDTTFNYLRVLLTTERLEPEPTEALNLLHFVRQCALEQHQYRMHKSFKRNDTAQYHIVGWYGCAVVASSALAALCRAAEPRLSQLASKVLMIGRCGCDPIQIINRGTKVGNRPYQGCG